MGHACEPSTVSELNQKIAGQIEAWRQQPIQGTHAYVYRDGIRLKRSWGGEVKNVSIRKRKAGCLLDEAADTGCASAFVS